jgi:mono/diheme cytochrome c family protein
VTLAELGARVAAPEQAVAQAPAQGDAERGKQLVRRYECNRCHDGTGLGSAPLTKNCFACHQQILEGRFPVSAAALLRFRPHVTGAREAPSLSGLGSRLESAWVRDYLLAPRDLRPLLTPTMPRLALDATQALDIASYLTEGARARAALPSFDGSVERGRELMDQKGCAGCHSFGGVPAFTALDPAPPGSVAARAAALAPDLRFTRERFRKDQLLTWLLEPKALKPDTLMPSFGLSVDEANDIASYVLRAELAPEVRPRFVALPLLTRRVSFEEVNREVLAHVSSLSHRCRFVRRRWRPGKYRRIRLCAARSELLLACLDPCGLPRRARSTAKLVRAARRWHPALTRSLARPARRARPNASRRRTRYAARAAAPVCGADSSGCKLGRTR